MASPGTNLQLRNHPELQPLILDNVEWTGNTIDSGAYGSVEEVKIPGALCAAKKIHDFLFKLDPKWLAKKTADENIQRFVEECKIMGRLRHPNIVQFLGLWFSDENDLPALVMEKMLMSLHNLLEPDEKSLETENLYIPLGLKCSILQDIAQGIAFLHNQSPPVVHRDLSARNVLLNSAMVAKIADMGMARIILPDQNNALLTKAPGAQVYMPPEALDLEEASKYDISIDVFSLGVLAIFVLSQEFPCKLKPHNYRDPTGGLVARSELQRRENYTKKIYSALSKTHPLVQMMELCLENDPNARPCTNRVLGLLDQAVSEMQDSSHLQLNRLQLLQVAEQNTSILQQGKAPQEDTHLEEMEEMQSRLDAQTSQIASLTAKLEEKDKELVFNERQLKEQKNVNAAFENQLTEYMDALDHQNKRSQLELETMKQKCDAWREEVEKLSPLRDEVAQLHQESARLQHQELAQVTEDNAGLGRQIRELSTGRGKVGELEQKANDYDQLMERVTELQQVRVQLENELTPLRAERAKILSENTTLREGSQVEKYVQLKNSYAALSDQCVQLRKSLTEESTANKKMELANRELQQQLEQTTDEKSLQAIRDRMERYKHEREQLRMNVAQLQNELQAYRAEQQENQETIAGLQLALKDSSQQAHHEQAEIWGKQVDSIAQKLEESDKRMRRYREERNTANIMIKSLQEQIGTLQNTVQQLQNTSGQFETSLVSQLQDNTSPHRDLSASPEEQAEPYSPDAYSDPHPGSGIRKPAKQMSSGRCTPSGGNHKHRNSLNTSGIVSADVTMKDGITRNAPIERPQYELNPKQKPAVIIKRKGGKYETGTLAFVGVLEGREMAGVILDFPSGANDGQFKDGQYYFHCNPSYGVYCPLSNIYVEANPATV